ncbi:MAG: hypothetical protein IJR14_11005 [Synergistaceae bacterium]|nr:hypothetical protein [Synergistaceae bacterium]
MQPISLLMSQFNVQNTAQMTRDAVAAAQDTAQGQEVVRDSVQRIQTVQANEAAAEAQKVHRRTEDEEREGRRRDARDTYQRSDEGEGASDGHEEPVVSEPRPVLGPAERKFEFYA